MTIEHDISDAILTFQSHEMSDSDLRATKAAVFDWLACALGGSVSPTGQAMQAFAETEPGGGKGTLLLPGLPSQSPRLAALVNGTISHALELDDIYAPALYHPGVCVIPAALAAAQEADRDGMTFLRAVYAGYEISNRLGTAINPGHYRHWHTTGTVGSLGATVAACVAFGLSRDQCDWAIGNATTMAAGLKEAFRSDGMTKPLHAGRAAESGYLAASLARAGFTGAENMLSGKAGFAEAMGVGADLESCLETLFKETTLSKSTFKRFAACGHTFAPVDVVLDLRATHPGLTASDIEAISVRTYSAAIEAAGNPAPSSEFEARFSIAFCVAAAMKGYDLSRIEALSEALKDDETRALCQRITITPDTQFDAAFPAMRGAALEVQMADGATHSTTIETRKGAPENPLTQGEMEHKAKTLIAGSPFRHMADAWMTWCAGLDAAPDVSHASLPFFGPSTKEVLR